MIGKSSRNQIEKKLPEWRDKFLSYKKLKKRLKLIEPKGSASGRGDGHVTANKRPKLAAAEEVVGDSSAVDSGGEVEMMTEAEVGFVNFLEDELEKFNAFFVQKEEEYIIKLKDLQDRVAKAKDCSDETMKIRKEIINFHGEMVLLEKYSALNYIGIVKILKKYDKRTGSLLHLPFIQKVLQQPFFTTDGLYKLIKESETMIECLFHVNEAISATNVDDVHEPPSTSGTTKNDAVLSGLKELSQI